MGGSAPEGITNLLRAWASGDGAAFNRLMPEVYAELGRLARQRLRARRQGDSIDPTTLVHEAYIRFSQSASVPWQNRAHFYAVAGVLMRRILVDHVRARMAAKRGGGGIGLCLGEQIQGVPEPGLLDVDAAIDELAALDRQQAKIVEMRFFGGLTVEETAEAMGISPATVKRDWSVAKTWIRRRLSASD